MYEVDGALFSVRHLWVLKEVVVSFELGGGDSGGRVDVRERDESVTGELCLCVVQGVSKLVYFLPVLRYASQPLDVYVRFATFT